MSRGRRNQRGSRVPRWWTMLDSHVSEVDAFTVQLERDPLLRSTIVAVAVFDRTPAWPQFVARVERATCIAPTFRMKLVTTPLRLAPPRWVVDPDFDLAWHLRRGRIPTGGGFDAVLEHARVAGMSAFDHDRPLWEFTLLEGLPKGRAALVMKVHHSLTDGIGGVSLAMHVVDLARTAEAMPDVPAPPQASAHGPFEPLIEALGHDVRQLAGVARDLARKTPAQVIGALRSPVHTVKGAARTVGSIAHFVQPVLRTSSPVMRERRLRWHYDTMDVPFDDLRSAARAVDGTLNDAFVAGIAGGFRLYHQRHCAVVDELHLTMPISTRGDAGGVAGNRVTLVRFALPVGIASPAERVSRIGQLCRAARREPALEQANLIAGVLNLLPGSVTGAMLKHIDLLASNVPGFSGEVFVAGARLEAFCPFGPTIGSSANVTLMSYAGTCNIGINTDAGAVPDPSLLTACLREGFDEVRALAST